MQNQVLPQELYEEYRRAMAQQCIDVAESFEEMRAYEQFAWQTLANKVCWFTR